MTQIAIVGEHMGAPADFADKRLRVGQSDAAMYGMANVRNQQMRRYPALLNEIKPCAVARGFRLFVQVGVASVIKGDPPTIDVTAVRSAAVGKSSE